MGASQAPLRGGGSALADRGRILSGPLRRAFFRGGLSQILGIYELHVQNAILQNLREGDVFYDIGAHNGYMSLLAASRVGLGGHVYAFEPLPSNAESLEEAMAANGVRNFTLVRAAVSNSSGNAPLYFGDHPNPSTPSLLVREGDNTLIVPTLTLDAFVEADLGPLPSKWTWRGQKRSSWKGPRGCLPGTRRRRGLSKSTVRKTRRL